MDKVGSFKQIVTKMAEVYTAKNADYGDSFGLIFQEFGIQSSVIRLTDKLNRIKSLTKVCNTERQVDDESIDDTLLDLANYAVMTLIERSEKRIC